MSGRTGDYHTLIEGEGRPTIVLVGIMRDGQSSWLSRFGW